MNTSSNNNINDNNVLLDDFSDNDEFSDEVYSDANTDISLADTNITDTTTNLNNQIEIGSSSILSSLSLSNYSSFNSPDINLPPINNHSHTSENNQNIQNSLEILTRFYREIGYIYPLEETEPKHNLFNEINKLLENQFVNLFEEFHNYTIPANISNLETEANCNFNRDIILSSSIITLKSNISEAKNIIKNDYICLLESEKEVLKEIKDLDKMHSLNNELSGFYNLLDNNTVRDKFLKITLEAYNSKLNNGKFRDKLYIYRLMLEKHKINITALKEINILNNVSLCPLCFQTPINYTIIPCGHTFCKACLDKCHNCGVCRGEITSCQKIYIL